MLRRSSLRLWLLVLVLSASFLSLSFDLDCWLAAPGSDPCPCSQGVPDACQTSKPLPVPRDLGLALLPVLVTLAPGVLPAPPPLTPRPALSRDEVGPSDPMAVFAGGLRAPPCPA